MGLPIAKFIASTNINRVVPDFFETGVFQSQPSVSTISNAMDVGNPSNFVRMLNMYENNLEALRSDVDSYFFTDEQTGNVLQEMLNSKNYLMDPHGAVGYLGLKKYMSQNLNTQGIFLETAHPGKFREVVESIVNSEISLPPRLNRFLEGKKKSIPVSKQFSDFKSLLPSLVTQ
jgi:threonine synthase